MGPEAAIRICFAKYAVFSGRAPLAEFWWWAFAVTAVGAVTLLVSTDLGVLFLLVVAIPSAAVASRRLHDTNRSGWWALLALVPFPGGPFLAALLVFESTSGDNRFGPDPLGREASGPRPPPPAETSLGERMLKWQHRR